MKLSRADKSSEVPPYRHCAATHGANSALLCMIDTHQTACWKWGCAPRCWCARSCHLFPSAQWSWGTDRETSVVSTLACASLNTATSSRGGSDTLALHGSLRRTAATWFAEIIEFNCWYLMTSLFTGTYWSWRKMSPGSGASIEITSCEAHTLARVIQRAAQARQPKFGPM